jgi:hypothetical protein
MEDYEGLPPEIAMYIKRIGDMREVKKYGRAVQLCEKALAHEPQPPILNVLLNFKGDSLYMVAWKVQSEDIMLEARKCFLEVLDIDPEDHVARRGIDVIDFVQWPEQPAEVKYVDPKEYTPPEEFAEELAPEYAE